MRLSTDDYVENLFRTNYITNNFPHLEPKSLFIMEDGPRGSAATRVGTSMDTG